MSRYMNIGRPNMTNDQTAAEAAELVRSMKPDGERRRISGLAQSGEQRRARRYSGWYTWPSGQARGRSREIVAAQYSISLYKLQTAIRIMDHAPVLFEQIKIGALSLYSALKIMHGRAQEPRRVAIRFALDEIKAGYVAPGGCPRNCNADTYRDFFPILLAYKDNAHLDLL